MFLIVILVIVLLFLIEQNGLRKRRAVFKVLKGTAKIFTK